LVSISLLVFPISRPPFPAYKVFPYAALEYLTTYPLLVKPLLGKSTYLRSNQNWVKLVREYGFAKKTPGI